MLYTLSPSIGTAMKFFGTKTNNFSSTIKNGGRLFGFRWRKVPTPPITSLPGEVWNSIASVPSIRVSNKGRIKRQRHDGGDELIHHHGTDTRVTISNTYNRYAYDTPDGKTVNEMVHDLVARLFIGNIPPGYEVDHINNDRLDNDITNLRIVTRAENNGRHRRHNI